MHFSKQAILEADVDALSPAEKRYLIDKYFNEPAPEWKLKLANAWSDAQEQKAWDVYLGNRTYGEFTREYRYTNSHLKILAEAFDKNEAISRYKGVRVTDFTKWVMSLYLGAPNSSSLAQGKHIERSVARLARPAQNPDWSLVYRDPLDSKPTALKISTLTFEGKALWGAPDLVYQNVATGELIIVERKASDTPIPSDGWPNLRAQLWAYAHIDDFQSSSAITLIGEVWGFVDGRLRRRGVLRWSKTDKDFDASCVELFSLYGGKRNA